MSSASQVLDAADGDRPAASDLLPLVYAELRVLAARRLAHESPGHTLQPTALVHEAYLRLVSGNPDQRWDSRWHFFSAAAEAMRRILVDSARRRHSDKRGGGRQRQDLDGCNVPDRELPALEVLALDEALPQLEAEDPEAAKVVHLHFFAGLSMEQIADVLGISRASAYRLWSYARAWLHCAIAGEDEPTPT